MNKPVSRVLPRVFVALTIACCAACNGDLVPATGAPISTFVEGRARDIANPIAAFSSSSG
ncbi:MAG: hypothetical protein H6707_13770 [Deltaproteobacteria bacterium]|nr:hypothetical protein [Deltaproteobacteria bacterium]